MLFWKPNAGECGDRLGKFCPTVLKLVSELVLRQLRRRKHINLQLKKLARRLPKLFLSSCKISCQISQFNVNLLVRVLTAAGKFKHLVDCNCVRRTFQFDGVYLWLTKLSVQTALFCITYLNSGDPS